MSYLRYVRPYGDLEWRSFNTKTGHVNKICRYKRLIKKRHVLRTFKEDGSLDTHVLRSADVQTKCLVFKRRYDQISGCPCVRSHLAWKFPKSSPEIPHKWVISLHGTSLIASNENGVFGSILMQKRSRNVWFNEGYNIMKGSCRWKKLHKINPRRNGPHVFFLEFSSLISALFVGYVCWRLS